MENSEFSWRSPRGSAKYGSRTNASMSAGENLYYIMQCPHCNADIEYPAVLAGTENTCASCQNTIVLQVSEGEAPAEAAVTSMSAGENLYYIMQCPHCNADIEYPAVLAGTENTCASCQNTIVLQVSEGEAPAEAAMTSMSAGEDYYYIMQCLRCNADIEYPAVLAGTENTCANCQNTIVLQMPESEAPAEAAMPMKKEIQEMAARLDLQEKEAEIHEEEGDGMGIFTIGGVLCYVFGVIDFAGMFFNYDLTGVSWSPIVAGAVGSALVSRGKVK